MATIDTASYPWQITNPGGNYTNNGFPAWTVPTSAAPPLNATGTGLQKAGDGVFALGFGGNYCDSAIKLAFFGVGTDNTAFSANVFGWTMLPSGLGTGAAKDLWVPLLVASLTSITLDSALPGVGFTEESANQFFASAITLGVGNSGISAEVISPGHAAHQIAHVVLDTKGFQYMEVVFSTLGAVTSCNALWSRTSKQW